jgi:GT2 family glycosyltransferase
MQPPLLRSTQSLSDTMTFDQSSPEDATLSERATSSTVSFVVSQPVSHRGAGLFSEHASLRYRLLSFFPFLKASFADVRIIDPAAQDKGIAREQLGDIVVFTKLSPRRQAEALDLFRDARRSGRTVVVDVCDNVFDRPDLYAYQQMLPRADFIFCASEWLRDEIEQRYGSKVVVLPEAYEGPGGPAKFEPRGSRLKLLWYGTQNKTSPVFDLMETLDRQNIHADLLVLSQVSADLVSRAAPWRLEEAKPLRVQVEQWSLPALWLALAGTDAVVLPTAAEEAHEGRSPNRLVEALQAGRLAIASPVPSYKQFAKFAILTDDITSGISRAVAHPQEMADMVAAGQAIIRKHHSPAAVASVWAAALSRALEGRSLGAGKAATIGDEIAGHVLEVKHAKVVGYAYDREHRDTSIEVNLRSDDQVIASAMASKETGGNIDDTEAPSHCGFSFYLSFFDIQALASTRMTVTTAEGHIIGHLRKPFSDLAQLHVRNLDEEHLSASIEVSAELDRPLAFDIYVNERLYGIAAYRPPSSHHIPVRIPTSVFEGQKDRTLSIKLRRSFEDIAGSPASVGEPQSRNLVSNPRFERWIGANPASWAIELPNLVAAAKGDASNADPTSTGAGLRLSQVDNQTTLIDASIQQELVLPGQPGDAVQVLLGGRATSSTEVAVLFSQHLMTGEPAVCEAALTLEADFTIQSTTLRLPQHWDCDLPSVVKLRVANTNAKVIEFNLVAAGKPGFNVEDLQPALDSTDHWNAVHNGDFTRWPHGLKVRTNAGRTSTAANWQMLTASDQSLEARLVEFSDIGGVPGAQSPMFGLAITSDDGRCDGRLETVLDAAPLVLAAPAHLTFLLMKSNKDKTNTGIAEIHLVEREVNSEGPENETRLARLARDVGAPSSLTRVTYPIPVRVARVLKEAAQRVLADPQRELVLVFDGISAISIGDVCLGRNPFVQGGMQTRPLGYIALEDPSIISQLDRVKGIDHWQSSPTGITSQSTTTDEPAKWTWPQSASTSIEIVICVHNALSETIECLESLKRNTRIPHTVTLVDDASEPHVRDTLRRYVDPLPWMKLVENSENLGYTRSANIGLRSASAEWIVLLNSDVIVTPGWLEGLLEAASARPNVAMVGPISNAATYQSVPELYDVNGKWKTNVVPDGLSIDQFAELVSELSMREFPEAPLLNGFCTLLRRAVLDEVGYFDEASFPFGYGEENDLCIRVRKAGYTLAVADHVFVFHSKSASFGAKRREVLAKQGNQNFRAKHPSLDMTELQEGFRNIAALVELRKRLRQSLSSVGAIGSARS